MAAFVVMERGAADSAGPDEVAFVRDGFHWLAFLLPVFWLLWRRLWIEALLAFAATFLLSALGELAGLEIYASLLTLLASLYFGLEAPAMRVRALARRGWREWGVLEAPRLSDAELLYGAAAAEIQNDSSGEVSGLRPLMQPGPPLRAAPSRGIGLVPYPGRG